MKVTTYQSDDERAVLTGMIVSTKVLSRIHSRLKAERKPFRSRWSNVVAGWCLDYFGTYQKAPRKGITELFRSYASKSKDEDQVSIVERFLVPLSDDYGRTAKELNSDHLIDVAARHFNLVRLERLKESIEEDLLRKDTEAVEEKLTAHSKVNLATSSWVKHFADRESRLAALRSQESEVLIRYPKALGEFFGPHFQRDGFIAFLAPEKRGKSFWLLDLAWRSAVKDRRRTLLYSVGDMSERQLDRRLITRTCRRPLGAETIRYPVGIAPKEEKGSQAECEDRNYSSPLSEKEMDAAYKKVDSSFLQRRCTPSSSTSVADIQADITELVREGWVPDVAVIDYADILAPEAGAGKQDYRHQINMTWMALRKLSQVNHILVVTATQSDAVSYETPLLRRKNFSEDKRKLSHVTGMTGINQTEKEKRDGVYRLNWIALREGIYYESKCVHVAGCLAIANPAIVSAW